MGDILDSQLQILKLIGGTLHLQYLIQSCMHKKGGFSMEQAITAVKDKLISIITIEGANPHK